MGLWQPYLNCLLLVQLEEELRVRVELWEQEHAQDFLVSGQRFMEHVTEQWRLHHLEKEKERQERVSWQPQDSSHLPGQMVVGLSCPASVASLLTGEGA